MNIGDLQLVRVEEDTIINDFSCGDDKGEIDLNDFLHSKAKNYRKELLATTFLLQSDTEIIAYFSIFNDTLKVEDSSFISISSFKKKLKDLVSHKKRHLKSFPAIKIGRLAVNEAVIGKGIGKKIIGFVIDYAIEVNMRCACKFVTLDAYAKAIPFYQKLGFQFLTAKDENCDERQMYLDLTPIINVWSE